MGDGRPRRPGTVVEVVDALFALTSFAFFSELTGAVGVSGATAQQDGLTGSRERRGVSLARDRRCQLGELCVFAR
jgi:hypothetical protein